MTFAPPTPDKPVKPRAFKPVRAKVTQR